MSWLRRKHDSPGEPDHDPCIDLARKALRKPETGATESGRRSDRAANAPHAVDADFCYGGETNPCA